MPDQPTDPTALADLIRGWLPPHAHHEKREAGHTDRWLWSTPEAVWTVELSDGPSSLSLRLSSGVVDANWSHATPAAVEQARVLLLGAGAFHGQWLTEPPGWQAGTGAACVRPDSAAANVIGALTEEVDRLRGMVPGEWVNDPFDAAARLAPRPQAPDATYTAWCVHYLAQALAAFAAFDAECHRLSDLADAPDRPDLGWLAGLGVASLHAAAAVMDGVSSAELWALTPDAGALNGEHEIWLARQLDRHRINPAAIDRRLNAADFKSPVPEPEQAA